MTTVGWCWTGPIPELLILEPEKLPKLTVKNKDYNKRGVIDCPSFASWYNSYYVLKSPVNFTATSTKDGIEINSDEVDTQHLQSLVTFHNNNDMYDLNKPMFQFNLRYLFIADEPCLMEITPPFLHRNNYKDGVVGGSFNIHSWVRSISWGYVFNEIGETLEIKRGDPLCYVKFTTPKLTENVKLVECELTPEVIKELERKDYLTQFKKGGIINLMSRALKLRPKKLIKIKHHEF